MELSEFGKRAWECALKRGKVHILLNPKEVHHETIEGLHEEICEFNVASETNISEHLKDYSASEEELADIAIVTFTELYRRGVDIEQILLSKMNYNELRDNTKD